CDSGRSIWTMGSSRGLAAAANVCGPESSWPLKFFVLFAARPSWYSSRRPKLEDAMKQAILIGLVLVAAGALQAQSGKSAAQAPMFEVDPFWPRPLPNHWVTGSTIGLSVDAQDRVWTIHRPGTVEANFKAADLKVADAVDDEAQPGAAKTGGSDPIGACCKVAPPVLVYDQAG